MKYLAFKARGFLFFCLIIFLFFSKNGFAVDPLVRVQVLSRYLIPEVELTSSLAKISTTLKGSVIEEGLWLPHTPLLLQASDKKVKVVLKTTRLVDEISFTPPRGSFILLKAPGGIEKKFIGKLEIHSVKNSLIFIEELQLEDYVEGVLESEMPHAFPLEALKAQAILIRTFALSHWNAHLKEGFNFCDVPHCQNYSGRNLNYSSLEEAVKATKSVTLNYQFKPIEAYYHFTCGGHTSSYQKVFGGKDLPYLQGVSDEKYCESSPDYHWENSISLKTLSEVLKKDSHLDPKGEINKIEFDDAETQGRVFKLNIIGEKKVSVSAEYFLQIIGKYLGQQILKSAWFEVEVKNSEVYFKGHGLGHGVGMCQWGAKKMAESGKNFDDILFHYFPGTHLIER